jgi:hypothetical protein
MTKFELYGETFIVNGDKIKSKRKDKKIFSCKHLHW